jgi:HEAT repeat protein
VTARPARRLPSIARTLAVAALALGASCQRPNARAPIDPKCEVSAGREGDRPYLAGDAATRDRAKALVARLSSVDQASFSQAAQGLAALGERAVPPLLDALKAPDPVLRGNAALVLGVLLDRRTIPDLQTVASDDVDANVRCEAGRALLAMGDPAGFDPLIDALSSDDARRRTRAIDTLAAITGKRMGYEPDGPPAERTVAARAWRSWRERQKTEFAPPPATPDESKPADAKPTGGRGDERPAGSR